MPLDVFVFKNPIGPLDMKSGKIINGATKVEWTERYSEPSDFKITVPMDYDPMNEVPLGSFVSHVDSNVTMLVENHELIIAEGIPELIISGRDAYVIYDFRVVGAAWHGYPTYPQWDMPNELLEERASNGEEYWARWRNGSDIDKRSYKTLQLFIRQMQAYYEVDDNDAWNDNGITKFQIDHYDHDYTGIPLPGAVWTSSDRSYLENIQELLKVDNFGLRTERPNRGGIDGPQGTGRGNDTTVAFIHPGKDRTREVIFSMAAGEIKSANFLWSEKEYRNTFYIKTNYEAYLFRLSTVSGFDRRTMHIDYSEADSSMDHDMGQAPIRYIDAGTGQASQALRDQVINNCRQKAKEVAESRRRTAIGELEINQEASRYRFRRDYDVGDLVTVDYGYANPEVKRITAYVEILDEDGFTEYPVLDAPRDKCYGYDVDI